MKIVRQPLAGSPYRVVPPTLSLREAAAGGDEAISVPPGSAAPTPPFPETHASSAAGLPPVAPPPTRTEPLGA